MHSSNSALALPLADEALLVEDGSVGAQERALNGHTVGQVDADVEDLTTSLDISIITCRRGHRQSSRSTFQSNILHLP
jgi:hypothetical protein